MTEQAIPYGFNIIGYASANLGLGHTTREFIRVLIDRGEPVSLLDLDAGRGRSKFDNSFAHLSVDSATELPYAVNLSFISALDIPEVALSPLQGLRVEGRLNVAFVWWELTDLPPHWCAAARLFDVLVAGSEFVRHTLMTHVPGVPVLLAPHPIRMPAFVTPNRQRFGLPKDGFLVYMGFEPNSDLARKNPFGAIDAFKTAFTGRQDCHLVVKVNNPNTEGKRLQQLGEMFELIHGDPHIHLIQESLPFEELLSLYASCDVFISLHRAEGLGLVPLEAMRLGKPVVATGWSGNLSYMNHRNACLVDFDFRPTDENSHFYGPSSLGIEGFWAEPDIEHAAAWLRKLADDPDFRGAVGKRAAADAARYEERARRAEFADELKSIWEHRKITASKNREDLRHQAKEAKVAAQQQTLLRQIGPFKYSIKRWLERYILWRFRR